MQVRYQAAPHADKTSIIVTICFPKAKMSKFLGAETEFVASMSANLLIYMESPKPQAGETV
ncbi:MAG: hypothetical protein K2Q11_08095 [Burkholderiaceae bacterium]|nr:hypothetical protein [Burkholderiaceae bacterium]